MREGGRERERDRDRDRDRDRETERQTEHEGRRNKPRMKVIFIQYEYPATMLKVTTKWGQCVGPLICLSVYCFLEGVLH